MGVKEGERCIRERRELDQGWPWCFWDAWEVERYISFRFLDILPDTDMSGMWGPLIPLLLLTPTFF